MDRRRPMPGPQGAAPPAALCVAPKAHPDQIEWVFEETEPGCALGSMRLSHFLRRTGVHFGGKCFSAQPARRRSALLVSVLAHAAALLGLVAAKPSLLTPPGLQSTEVMLFPSDPDTPDQSIDPLSSEAPIKPWWRPDKLHGVAALESIGATQPGTQVGWTAALGELPK